jgi:hypothetical protein
VRRETTSGRQQRVRAVELVRGLKQRHGVSAPDLVVGGEPGDVHPLRLAGGIAHRQRFSVVRILPGQ